MAELIPGRLDWPSIRRVAFDRTLWFPGYDFTGATMRMQVRTIKDATGPALIDLGMAGAGSQGVSFIVTTGSSGGTEVRLRVSAGTMTTLPAAASEPGQDLTLWWDFMIQMPGADAQIWLRGQFIVEAGVYA